MADDSLYLSKNNLPEPSSDPTNLSFDQALGNAITEDIGRQQVGSEYRTKAITNTGWANLTADLDGLNRMVGPNVGIDIYNQDTQQYLPGLYQTGAGRSAIFAKNLLVNLTAEAANIGAFFLTANNESVTDAIEQGRNFLIDSVFPTYTTESYATQDQSLWQKFGDAEFWNLEANETIAFLAGAIMTGSASAALKLGTRAARYGASLSKMAKAPSIIQKAGRGIQKSEKFLNNASNVVAQTYYEATAEANALTRELKDYYAPLIGLPPEQGGITQEEANRRIEQAADGAFWANSALLMVPNMITNNLIVKGMKVFGKAPTLADTTVNSLGKKIFDKNLQLISEPITASKTVAFGKFAFGAAKGAVSEGAQEGIQTIISDVYSNIGKVDYVSEYDLADQFSLMAQDLSQKWGTSELNQAIMLGAILGSMGGGVSEASSYLKDIKTAESLRSNLDNQYKANADLLKQVSKKDENGNLRFDKNGRVLLDTAEIAKAVKNQSMQIMDNVVIQDALDKGDYAKAERLFLSRIIAPLVYNHVNFENGKDLFMANVHRLLNDNNIVDISEKIPTNYGKGLENYYDLVAEEYQYMQEEGLDIITGNINSLNYELGSLRAIYNSIRGTEDALTGEPLTTAERKEFNKKKAEFAENAKYAFTVLGARKRQSEKILADLQSKITQQEGIISDSNTLPEDLEIAKKKIQDYKAKEKEQRRELKYLNSEYAKMTDPDWYKSSFKKYLKQYEDVYYTDRVQQEIERNKQEFINKVKDQGYTFKEEPKKSDYQNLDDQVVFTKNGEYYVAGLNGNNQFVVTKFNKDFKYDEKATTKVDWLMLEDEKFFENAVIVDKASAKNFMQNIRIRNLHLSYVESAQELFENQTDAVNEKQEQFNEIKEAIQELETSLSKLGIEYTNLKNKEGDTTEATAKLKEAIKDAVTKRNALRQDYTQLEEELNNAIQLQSTYQSLLQEIENYMATVPEIEYESLLTTYDKDNIIDRRTVIDRYFNIPEVQEIFKLSGENPISFDEYNNYAKVINKYRQQKRKLAGVLNSSLETIVEAKTYIVSTIAESLVSSISDYLNLRNQVKRGEVSIEQFMKTLPQEMQDLIAEYREYDSKEEFQEAVRNKIYNDNQAYDVLLDNNRINEINLEAERKVYKGLDAIYIREQDKNDADRVLRFGNEEFQKKVKESVKNIRKSLTDLEVVKYYRGTYLPAVEKFEAAMTENKKVMNDLLGGKSEEVFDFVSEFKEAFTALRINAFNIYQSLSADNSFDPRQNVQTDYAREQDENDADFEELYRLRKPSPYTTINGIVQIDPTTNLVKRDANNNIVLRDNQDSINANDYINSIDAADVENGDYVHRFVNADQLEELFQDKTKKAPFEGDKGDALYSVIYYKNEPAIYNGEIVFFGVAETSTYFPYKGQTTLNKEALVRRVFKPKSEKVWNVYTHDGVDYNLGNSEDLDAAASIAADLMAEEYGTWRSEVLENLKSGMEQYSAVTNISSGMPVNEFTVDPDTKEAKRKFKKVRSVLKGAKEVIISKTGSYRKGAVSQQVQRGLPYIVNDKGQLVRVYRGKLADQPLEQREAIVKLLGFLGQTRNIKDKVTIGNTQFSILGVGKNPGLIDLFINWGKTGIDPDTSKHLDIWLTGKLPSERTIKYNMNGKVKAIKVQDLVIVANNGQAKVNTGSPSVQAFIDFLGEKTANVSAQALDAKQLSKTFSLPKNINYKTKKVTTSDEKYKGYQDYIIETSQVSIVPEAGINPQFINRYFGFATDMNDLQTNPSKVKNYRKKKKQTDTQTADATVDTAAPPTPQPQGSTTPTGDTIVNFKKFPKGTIKISIPDQEVSDSTSKINFKEISFDVNYDFTDLNNPTAELDSRSMIFNSSMPKDDIEHFTSNLNAFIGDDFIKLSTTNGKLLSESFDVTKIKYEDQFIGLHDVITLVSGKTQKFESVVYSFEPDTTYTSAQDAQDQNSNDDSSVNCDGDSGKSGGKKGGFEADDVEVPFDI